MLFQLLSAAVVAAAAVFTDQFNSATLELSQANNFAVIPIKEAVTTDAKVLIPHTPAQIQSSSENNGPRTTKAVKNVLNNFKHDDSGLGDYERILLANPKRLGSLKNNTKFMLYARSKEFKAFLTVGFFDLVVVGGMDRDEYDMLVLLPPLSWKERLELFFN